MFLSEFLAVIEKELLPNSDISKRIVATKATQLKKEFGTGPQVYYVLEEGAKS